jgi:hypothetical protein
LGISKKIYTARKLLRPLEEKFGEERYYMRSSLQRGHGNELHRFISQHISVEL